MSIISWDWRYGMSVVSDDIEEKETVPGLTGDMELKEWLNEIAGKQVSRMPEIKRKKSLWDRYRELLNTDETINRFMEWRKINTGDWEWVNSIYFNDLKIGELERSILVKGDGFTWEDFKKEDYQWWKEYCFSVCEFIPEKKRKFMISLLEKELKKKFEEIDPKLFSRKKHYKSRAWMVLWPQAGRVRKDPKEKPKKKKKKKNQAQGAISACRSS